MKQNKYLPVLGAAVAAVVILLLMIFWPRSPSQPELRQVPAGESDEAAHRPADTQLPAGVTQSEEPVAVHHFAAPDVWFVAGAMGETYTDTLSGEGFRTGEADVYLGQSPPDGPYLKWYVVGRAYPSWDTSILPDGAEVLSATLVLELPDNGGREESLESAIYRGMWSPPIELDDWLSPDGKEVGRGQLSASRVQEREVVNAGQNVTLYAPEPAQTVRVALDPPAIDAQGITRLELRHAREGTPPTAAGVLLLGRSMISLEVEYRP